MTAFIEQQLPSEHEKEEKNVISTSDVFIHFSRIESGLEFILKHTSGPQFPRDIMVPTRQGQKSVYDKDSAMLHYQGALWEDCRIAAFYPGQENPDLIFIDLDRKDFVSDRALKAALTKILKRIEKKIGGHPAVLWSGRGYHIIQPINCDVNLDNVKELAGLVRDREDVNKMFLQFGAYHLSGAKKDSCNRTSLKSCLLRIPGSLNSKCKAEGTDPEVKIVQEWDGFRPDVKLMLGSFYSYLVAEKAREDQRRKSLATIYPSDGQQKIWWIEKLLETPIDDYRKRAHDLIIIPYLVVRKGMTDADEIEAIVLRWINRCNELEPLSPSYREFERGMRYRIHLVMHNMIPPMSFDKLQEENPELAKELSNREDS